MMALRSQDKRELLAQMEPAEEFVLVDGYNIILRGTSSRESDTTVWTRRGTC